MINLEQRRDAVKLVRDGWPDEAIERLTALSLAQLVLLRAEAAAGPFDRFPPGPADDGRGDHGQAPS